MKWKAALLSAGKALLIVMIFVVTVAVMRARKTDAVFVNKYASSDVCYADGRTAHFDSKNFGMVNAGDVVTVRLDLPLEAHIPHATLCFYIYHSVTEVRWDGRLLAAYGADVAARGDMVGNARFLVSIPEEAWGDALTITLRVTEDGAFNRVKNFRMYPERSAYQFYLDSDFLGFLVAVPMLLIGLIGFVALPFFRGFNETSRKGMYLASFAVLASLWIITSKGIQHLFGAHQFFWTQLEFVAAFTMVLPVLLYAYETETGRRFRLVLGGTAVVNAAYFIVCTVLHCTNVLHYCRTLLVSNILTFGSGIILLIFALSRRKSSDRSDRVFFSGMLILFFAGLFDLLRLNVFKYLPWLTSVSLPSVLPLGLLFFMIYMLCSFVLNVSERQRKLITATVQAENLSEMFASTPAGICLFRMEEGLPIIETNDTFYNIFGYTKEEAERAGFHDLLFPLDEAGRARLKMQDAFLLHARAPHTYEIELPIRKRGGEAAVILSKFFYRGNDDCRITANVIDITDRKRMEEDLRISEERYKLALAQSGKVFFFFDVPSRTMRLSDELAKLFGLPNEVADMPEGFLAHGLVEPESLSNYRQFYARIYAGEPSGDTVISCHIPTAPNEVLWYRVSFTSVFDAKGEPTSAVITYEDLSRQYAAEIAARWKQSSLVSMPEDRYAIAEYDLSRGALLQQTGGLFAKMPDFMHSYEKIVAAVLDNFIYEDDVAAMRTFLDRDRLLAMFAEGRTEDSLEYRAVQGGSSYRWTCISLQMIHDPYSGHVLGQLLFTDIHDTKSGQLAMQRSMDDLQKELESSRIKVMINQMQPHFLYNALSAIRTITRIDPDRAYSLLYDFTVHLRSSIKALSSDAPVSFADELKNIRAYLNIEMMRFGDSLHVNYEIDCESFYVIPLTIQPLAENAARHGVYPKGDAGGTVTIRSYETFDAYVVEVEDDGVGFDVDAALALDNNSYGLKNLIFRLNTLMHAAVEFHSELGKGSLVRVTIPKKTEAPEA